MAILLDTIKVPLQKTDEFSKFSQAVEDLMSRRHDYKVIVNVLSPEHQELLKKLLKTKRVIIGNPVIEANGTQPQLLEQPYQVPRVILKARRRKPPGKEGENN